MKVEKLSFFTIKNKLSRSELKKIMAGTGGSGCTPECPSTLVCCKCNGTTPTCVPIGECNGWWCP